MPKGDVWCITLFIKNTCTDGDGVRLLSIQSTPPEVAAHQAKAFKNTLEPQA